MCDSFPQMKRELSKLDLKGKNIKSPSPQPKLLNMLLLAPFRKQRTAERKASSISGIPAAVQKSLWKAYIYQGLLSISWCLLQTSDL